MLPPSGSDFLTIIPERFLLFPLALALNSLLEPDLQSLLVQKGALVYQPEGTCRDMLGNWQSRLIWEEACRQHDYFYDLQGRNDAQTLYKQLSPQRAAP